MSRSRGYVFTWNNYPETYREALDALPQVKYIVAAEEIAPTTNTPHLQGFVYWNSGKTVAAVRTQLPGCHVERIKGTPKQADDYCRKTRPEDGEPNAVVYSRGERPLSQEEKGDKEKQRYQIAWELAKEGRIEEIEAPIRLRLYGAIRRIERDYMPVAPRLTGPCGLWIYGLAGAGKTRAVLDQFPNAYPKPRSQWWDGYQGEDTVYVDDLDRYDVKLGGQLKLWSDAYPFIAEIKGGSKKIRPKLLIVTSQYQIEQIWNDIETRQALMRRFVVVEKILGEELVITR